MKIRSITCFVPQADASSLEAAAGLNARARHEFISAGYEVQSSRLATVPFPYLLPAFDREVAAEFAQRLEQDAAAHGFDYVSLGPALPQFPASYALVPAMLASTQNLFVSGAMTQADQVSLAAVRACAEIIYHTAPITPDGFANLRFCASANVLPGAPFFPAAYHDAQAGGVAFALAMQAADLAVAAFTEDRSKNSGADTQTLPSLQQARRMLSDALEAQAGKLSSIAVRLAEAQHAAWTGIDFSLAPFPADGESLGAALEALGVPAIGLQGSLAAAAIVADTVDQASFGRSGFSGLMLPVLEDTRLAQRAAEGTLTINDLLLYSAVCGTGLDTIPLPGNTSKEELYAVLLDVAALAQRLNKPLTARLMPIPGKKAGDPTDYDFAFFANSRVMSLRSAPLVDFLATHESFTLQPRAALWRR